MRGSYALQVSLSSLQALHLAGYIFAIIGLSDSSSLSPVVDSVSDWTLRGCDFLFNALPLFLYTLVATVLGLVLGGMTMIQQD